MYTPSLIRLPLRVPYVQEARRYPVGTTNCFPEKMLPDDGKARPPKNAKTLYQETPCYNQIITKIPAGRRGFENESLLSRR